MGWWECYDGTVIGDELADFVDDWIDKLIAELIKKYPTITRNNVLHTLAFCSGCLKKFDDNQKMIDTDKILVVMTIEQMREWNSSHKVPSDISKQVAPNTELMNVYNPFTGDIT